MHAHGRGRTTDDVGSKASNRENGVGRGLAAPEGVDSAVVARLDFLEKILDRPIMQQVAVRASVLDAAHVLGAAWKFGEALLADGKELVGGWRIEVSQVNLRNVVI